MVILLLALLVLGPDKLPEYARKAGRYMNEFRRMTSGFQEEFRSAMDLGATDTDSTDRPVVDSPTAEDDALHRTTEGPRLVASADVPPEPAEDTPDMTPPAPPAAVPADAAEVPAAPSAGAAPTGEASPAPGRGPELIVPSRPGTRPKGGSGSSSAA